MAYIDKSRAIGMLERFREEHSNLPNACLKMIDVALNIIKQLPTADVVEVKHGYWRDNIQKITSPAGVTKDFLAGYKCSACGRTEIKKEPYCNCGAKMDGRSEQDER